MADCANGYDPRPENDGGNPKGCRYHHQHSTRIFNVPTGEYLDGTDIELTREEPWCPGETTCAGCQPREARHGRLCAPCYDRAQTNLRDLPRQWLDLADYLPPGSAAGQAKVSGTQEQRIGITVPIADHRLLIERVLADWVDLHADALRHHRPHGQRIPGVSAPWLENRLEWAARQEWAADYINELRDLTSRARSLLNPSGRRHLRALGPCPEDGCTGTVTARLAPADDTLPGQLICNTNPAHTVASTDWIRAYTRAEKRRKRDEAA